MRSYLYSYALSGGLLVFKPINDVTERMPRRGWGRQHEKMKTNQNVEKRLSDNSDGVADHHSQTFHSEYDFSQVRRVFYSLVSFNLSLRWCMCVCIIVPQKWGTFYSISNVKYLLSTSLLKKLSIVPQNEVQIVRYKGLLGCTIFKFLMTSWSRRC